MGFMADFFMLQLNKVFAVFKLYQSQRIDQEIGFILDTFESNQIKITHHSYLILGQTLCYIKNLKFTKQIKTPEKVFFYIRQMVAFSVILWLYCKSTTRHSGFSARAPVVCKHSVNQQPVLVKVLLISGQIHFCSLWSVSKESFKMQSILQQNGQTCRH